MKNFAIAFSSILLLGHLCLIGLPWWGIVPIAAGVGFVLSPNSVSAFGAGFLAGVLLWGLHALWLTSANGGQFAEKIGEIFQGRNGTQLLYATSIMGGLLGGFGALTGQLGRALSQKKQSRNYYNRRKRSGRYV